MNGPDVCGLAPAAPDSVSRILDAAERCFRMRGYENTSVRAIAAVAGVSKSLVLYHFGCKERLFTAVQERLHQRLADAVEAVVVDDAGASTARTIQALDTLFAAMRAGDDHAAHTVMGLRALVDPALRPHVVRLQESLHDRLVETIRRVVGDQALPMDVDAAADLLSAVLTGIGLQAALEEPVHAERSMRGFQALVVAALHGRPREETTR